VGDWHDNLKHGIGKMTYVGQGEYYGYWERGLRHGEGVFTYTNKDVYSGNWKDGKKDGKGTYVFFDTGMKIVGNWVKGQVATGRWVYPNGTYYEGTFDHNKPKGRGKWVFKNGNAVEGDYTQTVRADVEGNEIKLAWETKSDVTKPVSVE